jgi:hypothetical protein
MRGGRGRWPRILGFAVVVLVVLLGIARLALEPVIAHEMRGALARMEDKRGTFSRVHVSVTRLSYEVEGLRIDKVAADGTARPYLAVDRLELGLYWSELIRGHVVGGLAADRPRVVLVSSKRPGEEQKRADVTEVAHLLLQLAAFRIDRAEVRQGEVQWVDEQVRERPRLTLHRLEATVENLSTRNALARGEPTVLAASGTLERSGQVSVFASADPLAKAFTFAGQARIVGLELEELGPLLGATTGVKPDRGTLDVSARFKAEDGHLTGVVRPVVRNPSVHQAKPGLGDAIKTALADVSIDILSDRVPGRNAVATTIPIQGDLTGPQTQLWPTILGVIRNAFVAGLSDSLGRLPSGSGSAEKPEKPAAQARSGGSKGKR